MTLRDAVAFLVVREVARKNEPRMGMAMKIARFPAVRGLADFDFKAQPSVHKRHIRELGNKARCWSSVGAGRQAQLRDALDGRLRAEHNRVSPTLAKASRGQLGKV